VQNATLYSNAVQVDDATAEQPNAEYVYWNSSAGVVLGDKAANINKTLSSDNEDMSYGPRFEAPDEATPLDKKYNIRPGRKLINTGYRYMTGDSYNKAENDKWYTDLFAYYPFGSVEEPVAPGDSLARVMFVDAGGNRRIAGNSIDIGAYEYQRLFYPNLYVKPNGFGLGSSWDDAMGDLQEAIYSAYYSGDPEESGTYGTVWVAGGDYVLPTTLQWMANVKVYGGFRGTNETKLTQRPGLLEKNAPESILSVEAEGVPVVRSDNDHAAGTIVENWAELNGFHITGSKNSPAVIVADSFAIVNSVIYNNVNPDGAVVETDGLLYNVLVHDNTVKEGSAAVVLDEHAAAIHVTAPGEGAQIGGMGKIINTINGEVTSVSGNAYSPLYVGDYITDDTHLRYQLSDQKDAVLFGIGALQETGVDHEGNPVTTIGGYTVPKIRNGKEYTDIIDLSTDCDVLGNVRLFTDKFHGEGEVIRPDYGCFETWNTTPQKVVNVSDNYYPHAGSVVYVGKESEVRLTDALTKDFAPSYLLLHHAAGLRTGEHAVSLYNLAIERDLKPLINDTTASWDMVSLPFSLEVGNGTMLNGVTIDGLPVGAIQAGDESGDDKNRLYLYEYDGAKRAEDLYSVVAPQNSKYWAFENNQMGANVGYLMATPSASDAVTVRFSKSSSALPVYEESAEEGKSILLKQHNLKTLVDGRPHFTYKENMGWNLFGVPYLCSYTTERMSIDHILYTYDPEASRFVSINSWEGNTIAPFSAVFTQTATVKESEELLFAKPVIPLNTLPAPHGVQLKISGSNLSAGCDYVSVVADNVYGEPMNFDMGNDALKMMSFDPRIPQIYVYNEKGVRFAHTQTADIEGETPVGIYTGESGIYEISLTEDSEYDRYDAVVLTDRSTGRKVDLKHAPYSFTVDDRAMETGRFSLSFKTLSDEMQQPTFYSPGKRQLRIVNLQGGESIGIYDTLGRQRASRKAYGESEEFELESGVYMIRIEGSSLVKGKVVVK
uniref:T9SS type A sorting domain-containing protein n=2 Tax=Barnesiella intestinihominis TaxID=487174 RepID=UPI003FEF307A